MDLNGLINAGQKINWNCLNKLSCHFKYKKNQLSLVFFIFKIVQD